MFVLSACYVSDRLPKQWWCLLNTRAFVVKSPTPVRRTCNKNKIRHLETSLVRFSYPKETQILPSPKELFKTIAGLYGRPFEKAEEDEWYCITYVKTSLIKPLFILFSSRFLSFFPFLVPIQIFLTSQVILPILFSCHFSFFLSYQFFSRGNNDVSQHLLYNYQVAESVNCFTCIMRKVKHNEVK